jgi:Tfp pilus assembly protein PilN
MTQTPALEVVVSPERIRRLLPIAADLLPLEIVESRRARKVRRSVVAVVVVIVVVLTGWYGYAVYRTSVARTGLSGAEADVTRLQAKQHKFDGLVNTQSESNAIHAQLSGLLANDLPWSHLVKPILADVPANLVVTDLTANLTVGGTTPSTSVQLPDATGHKLLGQLTIKGYAGSKTVVAAYVDALTLNSATKVLGLGNPYVTTAMPDAQTQAYEYVVQLDVTDAILGGRYTVKNDKKSGAK